MSSTALLVSLLIKCIFFLIFLLGNGQKFVGLCLTVLWPKWIRMLLWSLGPAWDLNMNMIAGIHGTKWTTDLNQVAPVLSFPCSSLPLLEWQYLGFLTCTGCKYHHRNICNKVNLKLDNLDLLGSAHVSAMQLFYDPPDVDDNPDLGFCLLEFPSTTRIAYG